MIGMEEITCISVALDIHAIKLSALLDFLYKPPYFTQWNKTKLHIK